MSPTARIPVVEFRSLLLAPIRVRLNTLSAFLRPQCAPPRLHRTPPAATCLAQRRALHLYKTARAKTALGMHKILGFDLYDLAPPSASQHKVNLVKSERTPSVIVEEGITLEELYEKHISPGKFVYLMDQIPKTLASNVSKMREEGVSSYKNYAVVKAQIDEQKQKKMEEIRQRKGVDTHPEALGKVSGAIKEAHISLSSPPVYVKMVLDRVYNFIEFGSPVEICIRVFSSRQDTRYRPEGLEIQRWLHEHFPHLRPDFILKSMPKGTEFLINPVTDGCIVQFVLGRRPAWMAHMDLTARAFKVKKTVGKTLPTNLMAKNYLARQERNAAKLGKSTQVVREVASGEQSDSSPPKKKSIDTRNIGTAQFVFELSKDGELSPAAAEKQSRLRDNRAYQNAAKHRKREEAVAARQKHRWENREGSA